MRKLLRTYWCPMTVENSNTETNKSKAMNILDHKAQIKSLISDIRECRTNRSIPTLLGYGWTVAIKGESYCLSRVGGGFNFSGTWNRGSVFWTREHAEKVAASISTELEVEVVHHNTLRDRFEATCTSILEMLLPVRNKQILPAVK